jgi:hypothetical protein
MGIAAVALALLGFTVGMLFRLSILLSVLALLLMVSMVCSLAEGFSFLNAALTIMAVQTVVQGTYFLGLVVRAFLSAAYGTDPSTNKRGHAI